MNGYCINWIAGCQSRHELSVRLVIIHYSTTCVGSQAIAWWLWFLLFSCGGAHMPTCGSGALIFVGRRSNSACADDFDHDAWTTSTMTLSKWKAKDLNRISNNLANRHSECVPHTPVLVLESKRGAMHLKLQNRAVTSKIGQSRAKSGSHEQNRASGLHPKFH